MPDTSGKRLREARKRQQREIKAERKRMRKQGLLGGDNSGWFAPGEMHRDVVDVNAPKAQEVAENGEEPRKEGGHSPA